MLRELCFMVRLSQAGLNHAMKILVPLRAITPPKGSVRILGGFFRGQRRPGEIWQGTGSFCTLRQGIGTLRYKYSTSLPARQTRARAYSSTEPCANKVHRSQTPAVGCKLRCKQQRLLRATLLVAAACALQLPTRKHIRTTKRYTTTTDETPAQLAEERRTWRRRKRTRFWFSRRRHLDGPRGPADEHVRRAGLRPVLLNLRIRVARAGVSCVQFCQLRVLLPQRRHDGQRRRRISQRQQEGRHRNIVRRRERRGALRPRRRRVDGCVEIKQ